MHKTDETTRAIMTYLGSSRSRKHPAGSTENKKGSPKTALKNYNEIIVVDYFSLA